MRSARHALFEVADALAQAFGQFGDFPAAEKEQNHGQKRRDERDVLAAVRGR